MLVCVWVEMSHLSLYGKLRLLTHMVQVIFRGEYWILQCAQMAQQCRHVIPEQLVVL